MLLSEVIQIVRDSHFNGPEFYYLRPSNRYIYDKLVHVRNMLLKKRANDYKIINSSNYQTVCIPIKEVECDCDSCKKYTGEIGNILSWNEGYLISGIYTKSGDRIPFVRIEEVPYYIDNKYANMFGRFSTINNGRIYVYGTIPVDTVKVTAVFQDPVRVNECGVDKCVSYLDREFPLQEDLLYYAIGLAFGNNRTNINGDNKIDNKREEQSNR